MKDFVNKVSSEEERAASKKTETEGLRARSGTVRVESKLVSFLYELMRDYLPPGEVETVVQNSQEPDNLYTNGWLAKYAEDLAKRLL